MSVNECHNRGGSNYGDDNTCGNYYPSSSSSGFSSSSFIAHGGRGNNINNYRTVAIGTQMWMAENLDYVVEGSKCYGEGGDEIDWDEDDNLITKTLSPAEVQANCDKYGRLYDWSTAMALPSNCNYNSCSNQIQSPHRGICPSGWHIPNNDDWDILVNQVADYETTGGAGKHLKARNGWEPYSAYSVENLDTWGFSALPGGGGRSADGSFYDVGRYGTWWSASEFNSSDGAYVRRMGYNSGYADWNGFIKSGLYSVRCLQDGNEQSRSSSSLAPSSSSFAHSGKGNNISNYRTVAIGTQMWMAENLDYVVEGSKCYDNDPAYCNIYGSLYDWATAMGLPSSCNDNNCSDQIQSPHRGICPYGWHIPSSDDWNTLSSYVESNSGCSSCDASKLKAMSRWDSGGNGTDEYGFSALPGGLGRSDGSFDGVGNYGRWWSAYEGSSYFAYGRTMSYSSDYTYWDYHDKSILFSVRCVQD
jgi:uncharacterized protein (TIGR02145 family)